MSGKENVLNKRLIDADGEVADLGDDFFQQAKRGRPIMPSAQKKRRINIMLDPDVAASLQEKPNSSAFVNAVLREKLGL